MTKWKCWQPSSPPELSVSILGKGRLSCDRRIMFSQFCSLLRTFSSGICEKVAVMVQGNGLSIATSCSSLFLRSQDSTGDEAAPATSHERDAPQPYYCYTGQSHPPALTPSHSLLHRCVKCHYSYWSPTPPYHSLPW